MTPDPTFHAAEYKGVRVPQSPFLTDRRIERIAAGRYEGEEIAGALSVVRPGDRVLELGAGLGLVGAVAAKNARPEAVLSFEANPELVPYTRALYRENGLDALIELRNAVLVAAPERPETVPFHLHRSFLGSSLTETQGRKNRAVEVPTEDFRTVMDTFRPNVLIMDIEGGELDILRHADLDGIRAVVIEFHPDLYGQEGMQACKTILRRAGFEKSEGPSTRLVWTCTRPQDRTRRPVGPPDPAGGWSTRILTLPDAIVQAPQTHRKSSPSGVTDAGGADIAEAAIWHGRKRGNRPFPAPDAVAEEIPGTWLWGGVLWSYFAHFIVESSGRLWALDHLETPPDGILYIHRRDNQDAGLNRFQSAFLAALGVDLPVRVVETSARVEKLIVPGQGFGLGDISAGTRAFRDFVHDRFGRHVAPDGGDRLYISRSRLGHKRGKLIGEDRIEQELTAQGYEIFHPQLHDMPTQIARYKAAKQVVASEGSALHLFAFVGRPDQQVALIPRRRSSATAHIVRHLESFTGASPSVLNVLRDTWQPARSKRKRLSAGEPDLPLLQAKLRAGGFIDAGPAWPPLTRKEIRRALGRHHVATGQTLLD
ncbi:MAG: FkbM family methyltransferase [Maritimibacter sp.]|nr:FkbM family methyltransferase [Maritimibacter sp.]